MRTFACIASGPSLRKADIDYCIEQGWGIAACNNAAFECDKLDVFLAYDARWWNEYGDRIAKIGAEMWTINPVIERRHKANLYKVTLGSGFSIQRGKAFGGELSGYQLLQVASWHGAKRIIMLGYDMQHTGDQAHFHPDHPEDWPNAQELDRKMQFWPRLTHQAWHHGIELINCTRETAITCIKRARLEDIQ